MKAHYEIQIPYIQEYGKNEPELLTPEDGHRYAMFVKGNDHHINGRTYIFRDLQGEYVSTFVSQYSSIIDNNIEPGIKDAVIALHNKGYLTYTSCQGHSDSRHKYIGVVFNTNEQKQNFIQSVNKLGLDIHWYDNAINTIERPCNEVPWWSDAIKLHIVYDDFSFTNAPIQDRRNKQYTDAELTKFWNIQMCRNYNHYESIVFTFKYPMVEKNLYQKIKKMLTYDISSVNNVYLKFLDTVDTIPEYEG
jgi:hypothetical protein